MAKKKTRATKSKKRVSTREAKLRRKIARLEKENLRLRRSEAALKGWETRRRNVEIVKENFFKKNAKRIAAFKKTGTKYARQRREKKLGDPFKLDSADKIAFYDEYMKFVMTAESHGLVIWSKYRKLRNVKQKLEKPRCRVKGCRRRALSNGFCKKHSKRKKTGSNARINVTGTTSK